MEANLKRRILGTLLGLCAVCAYAEEPNSKQRVLLQSIGTDTYYIKGEIKGGGSASLLVDTGSGYSVINHTTLRRLKKTGDAVYLKKLEGIMADGSTMIVPVYRISGINLGGNCYIPDIEAAVFPRSTRQILGLRTLRKVAPFSFDVDPPSLILSNCLLADIAPSANPPSKKVVNKVINQDVRKQPVQRVKANADEISREKEKPSSSKSKSTAAALTES